MGPLPGPCPNLSITPQVNERNHWVVLIVCYIARCFGDPLPSKPESLRDKPQILVLDSLSLGLGFGKVVLPKFRAFLRERLKWEKQNLKSFPLDPGRAVETAIGSTSTFKAVVPSVPKQPNKYDCGCYMLAFIELCCRSPPQTAYVQFPTDWVTPEQAKSKRTQVRLLL